MGGVEGGVNCGGCSAPVDGCGPSVQSCSWTLVPWLEGKECDPEVFDWLLTPTPVPPRMQLPPINSLLDIGFWLDVLTCSW